MSSFMAGAACCSALFLGEALASSQEKSHLEKFVDLRRHRMHATSEKERERINFALSEYFYEIKAYGDATRAFEEFLEKKEYDISSLLANAYLLKIARDRNKEDVQKEVKQAVFSEQFILLFEDFKSLEYDSALDNNYTIRYYVDRIEIDKNQEPFIVVEP